MPIIMRSLLAPLEAHVVTHTHWDREWYLPVERFRQRLVALVDGLIADPPEAHDSFLLDGQAIILEDYLALRPDNADALIGLLRDGRLEAGPWYVLADELIPSGEALVRNLFAGRRTLRRLHAEPPPVLYCPDSFGHPAALPSIAAGFGLPLIILWRGYGGTRWPTGDTVYWTTPGGDRAVVHHLTRDGYELGSHLPTTTGAAAARWQRMRAELVPRSVTGVMLVPNGADHHARQMHHREAVALLEAAGAADNVHRSSLKAFATRLLDRAAHQPLPEVRGELRDSYGYTWTLQGTLGSRAHEKRLNAIAERVLRRETEPWSALAALAAGRTRDDLSRRWLVEEAWRTVLTAHPHDTLCGCSIDEVAASMELRLRSAINQAAGLRDDSIASLIDHDAVAARTAPESWIPIVLVRNAAARTRSSVAIIEIEQFIADVPVGPGSASAAQVETGEPSPGLTHPPLPVVAALGPLQILSREWRHSRTESPQHYPDNDLVSVTRAVAWVNHAPPMGLVAYPIGNASVEAATAQRQTRTRARGTVRHGNRVATSRRSLGNDILAIAVDDGGHIALEHLPTGRRIDSLLDLLDEGDAGDLYTAAPRPSDARVQFRGVRRVHRGPLRGELALRYRVVSPAAPDGRSRRTRVDAEVTIRLTLDAGSDVLRLALDFDNRSRDHRLRLIVHSDLPGTSPTSVWADAAFGVVPRQPIVIHPDDAIIEHAPPTAPLHRYLSAFGANHGVTVFSDGLAEYEVLNTSVVVTLLRAVGELSRNDLPERPGHAGWPSPVPEAQCIGRFGAEFAVMLHGPRTGPVIDTIERTADDVLLPLVGAPLRSALRVPDPVVGVELEGAGLALSAVKESEDGRWLVLRCVNLHDETRSGRWRLPFAPHEAQLARLDETRVGEAVIAGRHVPIDADANAIVTILVR